MLGRGIAVLAVAGLLLASSPARSEVRFANEATGANYRVTVLSWWEIPFRSVVRQSYDFSCGAAAVATLLTYHYGRPTTERDTFKRMWQLGDREVIRKVGFSLFEMKTYLESVGYRAEGFKLQAADIQKVKRPMIALVELNGFKHFVVVKGVENGKILVGDPMLGLNQYSLADFDKVWNGIVLAIMETPDQQRGKYNLASDWGPWSRAPMDGGYTRISVGDLTDDLPPSYQITPIILLDVRVGTVQ